MREISRGSYCRHRTMEDWGVGLVKSVTEQRVIIFFEHGGTKPIAKSYVQPMIKPITADEIGPELRALLELGEQKPAPRAGKAAATDKVCKACHKPLTRVVYADKRNWKSCPKCSTQNGDFHAFYEYPRAFDAADAKGTGKLTEAARSSCAACRNGERQAEQPRFCGTL